MKPYTIQQNRRACKKALELYLQGDLEAARNAAKRVSWAFLMLWLSRRKICDKEAAISSLTLCMDAADVIKGRIQT